MTVESKNEKYLEAVQAAIDLYGAHRTELIPILNEVNRLLGFLPSEALTDVSQRLQVSKSQLYGVASFYHMLSTKKRGKHVIQFCESAPCHVVGGRQVWHALQENLNLKPGETSQDGMWTLITTSCLGVCGVGPVFMVDEDIFGNVRPEQIPEILARYSQEQP